MTVFIFSSLSEIFYFKLNAIIEVKSKVFFSNEYTERM